MSKQVFQLEALIPDEPKKKSKMAAKKFKMAAKGPKYSNFLLKAA